MLADKEKSKGAGGAGKVLATPQVVIAEIKNLLAVSDDERHKLLNPSPNPFPCDMEARKGAATNAIIIWSDHSPIGLVGRMIQGILLELAGDREAEIQLHALTGAKKGKDASSFIYEQTNEYLYTVNSIIALYLIVNPDKADPLNAHWEKCKSIIKAGEYKVRENALPRAPEKAMAFEQYIGICEAAISFYKGRKRPSTLDEAIRLFKDFLKHYLHQFPNLYIKKSDHPQDQSVLFSTPFEMVRQGSLTNQFHRLPSNKTEITEDEIAAITTFSLDDYEVKLPKGYPKNRIRDSLFNLFDYVVLLYTKAGASSKIISFNIRDYMAVCGLSDRKTARKTIEEDLETLTTCAVSYIDKTPGQKRQKNHIDINIGDAKGIWQGNVTFSFSDWAHKILKNYPLMDITSSLFRIDGRKNPNSRALLRKILEHMRINAGEPTERRISVRSLLAVTRLPTVEKVKKSGRQYTQRIQDPLERDLNGMGSNIAWEYCGKNGEPLRKEDVPFDVFLECNVQITRFDDYPSKSHLIEAREKQKEKAEKAKKKKEAAESAKALDGRHKVGG